MHKETCYVTTLDKEGEIIDRREFKRDSKVAIEACSYWYLHRAFFLCFANRLIVLDIFEKKRNRKVFMLI